MHNHIFISLKSFIPLFNPDATDIVAIAETKRIKPSLKRGVTSKLNKYCSPLAI